MIRHYLVHRKWVLFWTLFLFGVTLIPYLLGYALEEPAWRYAGFVFGVEDGNSYIAKMLMGANGDWLFRTPYTTLEQPGVLAFLPYIMLGKLSSAPGQHEQLAALFQGFRLFGIIIYCLATFDFLQHFTSQQNLIRWGVVISCVGGGLGWLTLFGLKGSGFNGLPIDLYSPESFGFMSLLGLPHLAVSRGLLLWGFGLFARKERTLPPWKNGLVIGILWLMMGFFQPLSVVTAWAGLGGAWLVAYGVQVVGEKRWVNPVRNPLLREWFITAAIAVVISSFWVFYNVAALLNNPFLKGWSEQNIILSPGLFDYLLGFSLLLIPAGLGTWKVFKNRNAPGYLLVGFAFLFPLLAYFPINLQRRLPDGIWVVLAALAIIGLGEMSKRWRNRLLILGALGILTSLFLLLGGTLSSLNLSEPVYVEGGKIRAFEALAEDWQDTTRKPVLLANFVTSNEAPAWVYLNVLIGHGPESVGIKDLLGPVDDLLGATILNEEQLRFIQEKRVDYILLEKANLPVSWSKVGELIYHEAGIWLIRVSAQVE